MSKSKHTPGPWSYDPDDRVIVKEEQCDIAHIDRQASDADANLIAAAPELLEALEIVQRSLDGKDVNLPDLCKKVAAAIAKANGKESK